MIALLRTRPAGLTWHQITAEVDAAASAVAVWEEHHPATLFDDGPQRSVLAEARADLERWRAAGLGFLTFLDDDYPAQLREVHDLPPVLFHRGRLVPDDVAVSVVGSRNASDRGLAMARSLAAGLVDRGIAVVAGLAKGIDTVAHIATLEAGGRTVAVIGTGITRCYPAENRALQDRIATDGLVLSQFWPDAPPTKQTFPMRNAVMSGYGRATIVVEAGEHSGARIQARQAVAHGRPVILTELVVGGNQWARAMVGRPGVHVAADSADALAVVDAIVGRDARISALFTAMDAGG